MIKELFVDRLPSEKDWTLSKFYSDDQSVSGVGVEDEKRDVKVKGETRIDNATYPLGLRHSPKFSKHYFRDDEGFIIAAKERTTPELKARYHTEHELIWVMNVPKFEYVLWHWGNDDDDTDACYIVGSIIAPIGGQKGVQNSRKKYVEIYPKIWRAIKAGQVNVTYRDKA